MTSININLEKEKTITTEPYCQTPKEKECWHLYRRMCDKGVFVSFDTVLRYIYFWLKILLSNCAILYLTMTISILFMIKKYNREQICDMKILKFYCLKEKRSFNISRKKFDLIQIVYFITYNAKLLFLEHDRNLSPRVKALTIRKQFYQLYQKSKLKIE